MAKKHKDGVEIDEMVERNEVIELTKVAKSWEFTCSFCFKKFPSAQAMGGHQNAHRSERLEEKRLFVRDPITYRKRAFIRAIKEGGSTTFHHLHAPKNVAAPPTVLGGETNCFRQRDINGDANVVMMNFLPPKEFHKNKSLGDHVEDHNLDLTLKL